MALNNVNKVSFHHPFSSTLHVKCCERKHTQCVTRHDRPTRKVMHRYRPAPPVLVGLHKHGICGHVENVGPHLAQSLMATKLHK